MARPTRPKAIPDLTEKTSMATGDIMLLTRLTDAPDDYENFRISWDNILAQILTNVPTPDPVPSELSYSDNLAVENFEDYDVGTLSTIDMGYGWLGNGVATGLSIVERAPFGNGVTTHKRMSVASGGEYARKFAWGDNWNSIVLCMLVRINGVSTFGPSQFAFGINSGTTFLYSSSSCLNFVGIGGANGGASDATITAGTRMSYFNMNPSTRFYSKRGATLTDRTSGSGSNVLRIPSTEGFLAACMIQCDRPVFATDATSITYAWSTLNTTGGREEFPMAKRGILSLLEYDTATSSPLSTLHVINCLAPGGGARTVSYSFDQSTGKLDTLNLYWDQSQPLEVAAIGARKIY